MKHILAVAASLVLLVEAHNVTVGHAHKILGPNPAPSALLGRESVPSTCSATLTPDTSTGSRLQQLLTGWAAAQIFNATVCFSSGLFTFDVAVTIPTGFPGFSLSVIGEGSSNTTLDGSVSSSLFSANSSNDLSFSSLKIQHCSTTSFDGTTRSLTGTSIMFSSNAHVFSSFVAVTRLVLTSCVFTGNGNTGGFGAMLVISDDIFLNSCDFFGNDASGANPGGFGAGINIHGLSATSRATITSCLFIRNVGSGGAAGIFSSGLSLVISSCIFDTNSAGGNIAVYGGAVTFVGSALDIYDTQFLGNNAECGGMAVSACATQSFSMLNSTIESSTSSGTCTTFPLVNATIAYHGAAPTMSGVTFSGNTIRDVPCPDVVDGGVPVCNTGIRFRVPRHELLGNTLARRTV